MLYAASLPPPPQHTSDGPVRSNATPMHQRAAAAELDALAPGEDLQGAGEALLGVAFALDEFAAERGEGGGVADGEAGWVRG